MRTALALAILVTTGVSAFADGDTGPVIVFPMRHGVPVVINGEDVAYTVLEGDWGLGKGVHIQPTVYPGHWPVAYKAEPGHYYPRTGKMPGYGRLEIHTPSRNLPAAETYFRSWSAESQPTPPDAAVPFDPPPIILAPRDHRDRPHEDHHPPLKKVPGEPAANPAPGAR